MRNLQNTDGFKDNKIHCPKPKQVANNTGETLAKETAQLHNNIVYDNEDPFMSSDNEDFNVEMEEDKTIVNDD